MNAIKTTAANLECTVASLRGLRIEHVAYGVLTGDLTGREPEQWDRGSWHQPTFGCQTTTHIDVAFTVIWANSFGAYGVDVFDRPIEDFLVGLGALRSGRCVYQQSPKLVCSLRP